MTEPRRRSQAEAKTPPPKPPPIAKRVPQERSHHGDTVVDEYAWLADKDDPETIGYLTAENAYTESATAHLASLRETVFGEIKDRTQETDLSVPVRKQGFWYYTRTVEGQQYGIHCRRAVRDGELDPPEPGDGAPLPGEQVLLDGNQLAEGHEFFSLGTFDVSPDGRWLAYSVDFTGDERFTLRVKDLSTGQLLGDEIRNVFYGCAWSIDASTLFYLTVDDAWRPHRVWRHRIGAPVDSDELVYEETDERFWVGVELTRSQQLIMIESIAHFDAIVGDLIRAADTLRRMTAVVPEAHVAEWAQETGSALLADDDAAVYQVVRQKILSHGQAAIAWIQLLGPQGYVARVFLQLFPGQSLPWNIYSVGGIIFVLTVHYFILVFITVAGALERMDASLEEAARASRRNRSRMLGFLPTRVLSSFSAT